MNSFKHLLIILFLLSLTLGCEEEKPEISVSKETSEIQSLIEDGNLLVKIEQEAGTYVLTFEYGNVLIPVEAVASIRQDYENWNTILTFANQQEISIPTLGGDSLDKAIQTIQLNPSGFNPLAANIFVSFPVKGRAKIIIHGKEGSNGTVTYLFKDYKENHDLPILGLYPDYENKVSIILTDKMGKERARALTTIKTAPLDIAKLPRYIHIKKRVLELMEPGMTLVNDPGSSEADTSCPYMIDVDGEIRWVLDWRTSPDLLHVGAHTGLHRLDNGNYLLGDANNAQLAEVDILGNVVRKWDLNALGYNFHHEAVMGENGKLLVAVTKNNAKLNTGGPRIFDFIIEMNPDEGTVEKEWDLVQILDSARYTVSDNLVQADQTQGNWVHHNALLYWGDDIFGSARYQGLFKHNRNGELLWVLAPHKNWRSEYEKYLLTPLDKEGQPITDPEVISGDKSGEDFDWPWGQHTLVIKPDGHVLVFDNGYARNHIKKPFGSPGQYSRIVEYEIDEAKKTVRQVWEYGKDRPECYALAMSSVQYLPQTGHVLFCPGVGNKLGNGSYGGRVVEIYPETNEVVYELEIGTSFHRANRLSLYPDNF